MAGRDQAKDRSMSGGSKHTKLGDINHLSGRKEGDNIVDNRHMSREIIKHMRGKKREIKQGTSR